MPMFDPRTQTKTDMKFAKKDEEGTMVSVQEPKALTLHQLQELIREIFKTKKEFDAKNLNAGIPRETMEQYLYTYLTNKYGLKVDFCDAEPGRQLGFHDHLDGRNSLQA